MSAQGALRPLSRALWRRPRLKLALLLSAPVGWLVGAYLGSLAVLFASALWSTDSFTGAIVRRPTADKNHCATFHAEDEAYFGQIWYWTTPLAQCVDGRTNVTCKDYAAWTQAWTTIKG